MNPVPYALAGSLLLRDAAALLDSELAAELAATEAQLLALRPDVPLSLPAPHDLRRSYWEVTRDLLPQVALHVMERSTVIVDSAGIDTAQTNLRVYVVVGEGDLGSINESGYSDAMFAYLGAISGLLQRRLPRVACHTSAVHEVRERRLAWEPAVDTLTKTWIQRGRLDVTVFQSVTFDHPPEITP